MTRNELINDVVRVYFEGGNWQKYIKELVREVKLGEINISNSNYMHNNIINDVMDVK